MNSKKDKILFWGCFVALITTSFAFITRAILINGGRWATDFDLNPVQAGELFGAGVWPFAISIILFSLVIDKIGYRAAMLFSFCCYLIYGLLAFMAYSKINVPGLEGAALAEAQLSGYKLLYLASVIVGLGNGTVEAFINPVVATMFQKEKTKWLNILHAGWPGGLVIGGIITVALNNIVVGGDWRIIVGIMVFPAVIYLVMLLKAEFPVNERVEAGASYREMLAEFGGLGALVAGWLITAQLGQVLGYSTTVVWILTIALTLGYVAYCRSAGRIFLFVMVLIMMPLAITELGTDGWITGLMEEPMLEAGFHPAWVLIYTSAIMMVLRLFTAGHLVKLFSPLGLLAICSALAIVGLFLLSNAHAVFAIFAAATLYGLAKTYFWPTMLGVVSEQCPKGGALTLNAIAGIGMLAVGIIGTPLIGYLQSDAIAKGVEAEAPQIYTQVQGTDSYVLGSYDIVDSRKVAELSEEDQSVVDAITKRETQGALARMTTFPMIMLVAYIALIFYFKSRGGYKPVEITADDVNVRGAKHEATEA